MSKNIVVVLIFSALNLTALSAQAERLSDKVSPKAELAQSSVEKRESFLKNWKEWIASQEVSADEQEALLALVSEDQKITGPDVLEKVDSSIVADFYGFEEPASSLMKKTAKISTSTNRGACLQYELCVIVSIARQRMTAYRNGQPIGGLSGIPVSTARPGKITPRGLFTVNQIAGPNARSSRYKGAYMGYRMQIDGHYFLHATSKKYYSRLGRRASAGCVRMADRDIEEVYDMLTVGSQVIIRP